MGGRIVELGHEKRYREGIEQGRREATAKYGAENAKLKAQIAELQQYKKRYDKLEAKFNKKTAAPQR
ncbi:MAG: hypothetical protein J6M62_07730 [Selenomonadaceae bacterium]|nr:hypothetical protein [Selenomonadaceae bacterium]